MLPLRGPTPDQIALFRRIGERLDRKDFIASNDGNLSVRDADGTVLVTAAGSRKGYLRAEDIVRVDLSGRPLAGSGTPSSETAMHLAIYRLRPEARAVVHAHPPVATGFSVAREPMDACVLPEVIATIGSVPLASYATPGTPELGASLEPVLRAHDVVLLANHGAVAVGPDLEEAYFRMERLEHTARILLVARLLGRVETLSSGEVSRLLGAGCPGTLPCRPGDAAPERPAQATACPSPESGPLPISGAPAIAEIIAEVLRRRMSPDRKE
jgi:L-fuculose-phosphate aldolase